MVDDSSPSTAVYFWPRLEKLVFVVPLQGSVDLDQLCPFFILGLFTSFVSSFLQAGKKGQDKTSASFVVVWVVDFIRQ